MRYHLFFFVCSFCCAISSAINAKADLFVDGLDRPLGIIPDPILTGGRLFIIEKSGKIRISHKNGTLMKKPFLDIGDLVLPNMVNEGGLLGLAFVSLTVMDVCVGT
jgi:hypothetical protein